MSDNDHEIIPYELQSQKDKNAYDFAVKTLEAQIKDRQENRVSFLQSQKYTLITFIIIAFFVLVLLIVALLLDKDAFIADLIKVVIGAFGGGGIGYTIGRRKNKAQ